ncbi:MAG TPA: NAD(P)-binding domain-containing protein [Candidatus Acidoferrales bacterium]|nr:NAD(P)-binding domain-containing protein [Candidatus Acidoferrales bacterium]
MADVETTIVGAGPYGLSIAAYLRAARVPFQMFGTPMESWQRYMPEGMMLKSERFASNLWDPNRRFTFERYCMAKGLSYQPVGHPLSLASFLKYAEWFRHYAAGESRDVRVVRIRRDANNFSLELADGTIFASRRVILATGHMPFRKVPPQLSQLHEPLLFHSANIGDVRAYRGRDVTIIGAGQSALETAALLHETGAQVRILARGSRIEWNSPAKQRPLFARILAPDAGIGAGWKSFAVSELPQVFRSYLPADKRHHFVARAYGPSGAWWLRDRVDRQIELQLNCVLETAAAHNGGVRLVVHGPQGQREYLTDRIIAGTGFIVDVDRLEYLDAGLRQSIARESGGVPALSSHFETSVPGLFIVGVASSPVFGPIMRFMYGAKHVAPVLARLLKSAA